MPRKQDGEAGRAGQWDEWASGASSQNQLIFPTMASGASGASGGLQLYNLLAQRQRASGPSCFQIIFLVGARDVFIFSFALKLFNHNIVLTE